jgi:ABC-type sugar transport system ATPase subunit
LAYGDTGEDVSLPLYLHLEYGMSEQEIAPLIETQGLEKSFFGTRAVAGVNFTCYPGEVHGLVGENGAGKSTLMKMLAGVYKPDRGKILLRSEEVKFSDYSEARRAGIGVVYQELSLLPELTVGENIVLGVWPSGRNRLISWNRIHEISRNVLQEINVNLDTDILVGSLPMALRQMVEIGKVLAQESELIIFDEPTAPLSHDEVKVLFKILDDLKHRGKGIIFISHRLDEVLNISDRITVMKDGQVVTTEPASAFDHHRLVSSMVGREMSEIFPPKPTLLAETPELFSYSGVLRETGTRVAFSVRSGEVTAIGGLQGQGQLALLQSIFGKGGCDSITIRIQGKQVVIQNPRQAMKEGIALIPDNRNEEGVFLILSVLENLAAATLSRRRKLGFIQKQEENKVVQQMIEQLSIKISSPQQLVQSLSGGNMQKVVLGKWLIFKPRVVVLLEPTKGVDVATKQQIYLLIRELADQGVAVILNTSDMLELIGLCDRVLIMNQGILTACLDGDAITEKNIMTASVSRKNIMDAEMVQ